MNTTTTTAAGTRHSTDDRTPARARWRLTKLAVAAGIAGAATVAVGAGSASAMTMQEWRARCAAEGGEWNSYFSGGMRYYECMWVLGGGGYSYDVFYGRGNNVRLDRSCGGTFRAEYCIDL